MTCQMPKTFYYLATAASRRKCLGRRPEEDRHLREVFAVALSRECIGIAAAEREMQASTLRGTLM